MLRQAEGEFGTRGEDEARPDETRRDKTRRTAGGLKGKPGREREREGGADRERESERARRVSARESEGRRVNDSGAI